MATWFVPSLDEIEAAAEQIRRGWPPEEHEARLSRAIDLQAELLASMLRPMAIEAGLIPADEPPDELTG